MSFSKERSSSSRVRIFRRTLTLARAVDLVFDPIRRHAADDAMVSLRQMEGIRSLAAQIRDRAAAVDTLLRQAELIERAST